MGGILEMCNVRLYGFWGSLPEALRTGEVQNEAKQGKPVFRGVIYRAGAASRFSRRDERSHAGAAHALAA